MYRKYLSAVRAQAVRPETVRAIFAVVAFFIFLPAGYAASDTSAQRDTGADSIAAARQPSDSTIQGILADTPATRVSAASDSADEYNADSPLTVAAPAPSEARTRFVRSASALRGFIGRKLSGMMKLMAIPGVTIRKMLLFGGSVLLILVTIGFYQSRRNRDRFMTTTRLSIMDKEVQRACGFIEDHYDDPELDIHKICGALVTGGAFLEALFVKELGLSIRDFITQVRINRAKIALRKTPGIPIADLAAMVGFSSEKTFADNFSALSGVDVEAYRKALGKHGDASE